MKQNQNWVRVQEVAAYFEVTRAAIYKWVRQGRIKALRMGDAVRITPEEFEYLKANGLRPAQTPDNEPDFDMIDTNRVSLPAAAA